MRGWIPLADEPHEGRADSKGAGANYADDMTCATLRSCFFFFFNKGQSDVDLTMRIRLPGSRFNLLRCHVQLGLPASIYQNNPPPPACKTTDGLVWRPFPLVHWPLGHWGNRTPVGCRPPVASQASKVPGSCLPATPRLCPKLQARIFFLVFNVIWTKLSNSSWFLPPTVPHAALTRFILPISKLSIDHKPAGYYLAS